jgi:hypothetical protein
MNEEPRSGRRVPWSDAASSQTRPRARPSRGGRSLSSPSPIVCWQTTRPTPNRLPSTGERPRSWSALSMPGGPMNATSTSHSDTPWSVPSGGFASTDSITPDRADLDGFGSDSV